VLRMNARTFVPTPKGGLDEDRDRRDRRRRTTTRLLIASVMGAIVATLAGGAAEAKPPLRVVVVLEPGMRTTAVGTTVIHGLRRAITSFGVSGRVVTLSPKESFTTALSRLAAQRYDLILAAGFVAQTATEPVALRFPETKFAMIDVPIAVLKRKPRNVLGTVFRSEQAAFLAGYLAALVENRRPGKDVISSVGGIKFYAVDALIAGYEAGARRAVDGIVTLRGYSNSFLDTAKCKRVALAQIAKGSRVVFQVAGRCGDGALEAAKEKGVWGIGVDVDQSSLGPHILTSALKGGNGEDVYRVIEKVVRGRFRGGRDLVLDLRNGGVGLGKISPRVPRALVRRIENVRRQIISGAIRNIPTTVK
jgi:basic membrane protein A